MRDLLPHRLHGHSAIEHHVIGSPVADQDAAARVIDRVAGVNPDAAKLRHVEQSWQHGLEPLTLVDDDRIASDWDAGFSHDLDATMRVFERLAAPAIWECHRPKRALRGAVITDESNHHRARSVLSLQLHGADQQLHHDAANHAIEEPSSIAGFFCH